MQKNCTNFAVNQKSCFVAQKKMVDTEQLAMLLTPPIIFPSSMLRPINANQNKE